jgi:hypothetical protein
VVEMFNEDAVGLVDGFDRFNDGVINYFKYEFLGAVRFLCILNSAPVITGLRGMYGKGSR